MTQELRVTSGPTSTSNPSTFGNPTASGNSTRSGPAEPGDGRAVVEFGGSSIVSRRTGLARWLSTPRVDHRVVPVVSGLGAVAVFASLIEGWQSTTLTAEQIGNPTRGAQTVSANIDDIGVWGTSYLMGVFAVVTATALVFFGAPAVRRHARVAGLALSGALLALLVATTVELGRASVLISSFYLDGQKPPIEYGRGIYTAFLGVAASGLALYLAGRFAPAQVHQDSPTPGQENAEPSGTASPEIWSWQRQRPAEEIDDGGLAPPADLSVGPTAPFVHLTDRAPGR